MQTIIVEIFVPAVSAGFDFRLPSTGRIGDIVSEVIRILESVRQNLYFDKENPVLCDRDGGRILLPSDTVALAGLKDGARLLLV